MPPLLTKRFARAFRLARKLHAGQQRKANPVPYVSHLLAVTALVLEYGGSEDEAIAALLHDAVEDQGGLETLARIRQRFGPEVADMVAACSDAWEMPKPPWRERKERALARLRDEAPPSVLLIALADRLHNLYSLQQELAVAGEAVWGMFRGGREGTLWHFRESADAAHAALARYADLPPQRRAMLTRLLARYEEAVGEIERGDRDREGR